MNFIFFIQKKKKNQRLYFNVKLYVKFFFVLMNYLSRIGEYGNGIRTNLIETIQNKVY